MRSTRGLVMARITAFGQTGPLNQGPGLCGDRLGVRRHVVPERPGRPPARAADARLSRLHDRLFTAFGVMAALRPSRRDRRGAVDRRRTLRIGRSASWSSRPTLYGRQGIVRERGGLQHAGWPGGAFETQDGKWIVFTAPGAASLRALVRDDRPA
jgi:formyl-CoA transferase